MYNTKHKGMIIDIFKLHKNSSMTAQLVYKYANGSINRATVYRQINNLVDDGIIRKIYNSSNDTYEYQYSDNCNSHFHLKCSRCGKIIHLECKDASEFSSHIFNHHGFLIDMMSSTINGVCRECGQ